MLAACDRPADFRLHRLHDSQEQRVYIVAEEAPQNRTDVIAGGADRRTGVRCA